MDQLSDARLIDIAKAGDQSAFAELYNRHFDQVYDFAARLLRDPGETAEAVRETFFEAMTSLGGLHDGAAFLGRTFAIARASILHALERHGRSRPPAFPAADGAIFAAVDPAVFPELARDGAALVWEAAAGLDPRQLSLLDLHLRQGLDSHDVAGVLHVTPENAALMLRRLEKAATDSLGAFLLLRDDAHHCPGLDAALGSADIAALPPETRRAIEHHIAGCRTCEARKSTTEPLAVFAALLPVAPPEGMKARVLAGLLAEWPGPASSGGRVERGTGRRAALAPGGGGARRRRTAIFGRAAVLVPVLGGLAAILLGALFLPQSPVALLRDGGGGHAASPEATPTDGGAAPLATPSRTPAPARTPTNSPTPVAASPTRTVTSAAGAPTVTPTPTPSATTPPTNTSTATVTPTTQPATATPTATATPCVPQLSALPLALNIPPGGTSSFVVRNGTGCVATFFVATDQQWLTASGGGSLGFGESAVTVAVVNSLVPETPGTYTGHVEVSWSNGSIAVTVSTQRTSGP